MKETAFDPARRLDIYLRIRRENDKTFRFYNRDGTDYDLTDKEFELLIKTNSGEINNVIRLTDGSGLTKVSNSLTAQITSVQARINEGQYYWELYRPDLEKTWLSGYAYFTNRPYDGVDNDQTDITISETVLVGFTAQPAIPDTDGSDIQGTLNILLQELRDAGIILP